MVDHHSHIETAEPIQAAASRQNLDNAIEMFKEILTLQH